MGAQCATGFCDLGAFWQTMESETLRLAHKLKKEQAKRTSEFKHKTSVCGN
jgi:hypothetical protein